MGMLLEIGDDGKIVGKPWKGVPEFKSLEEVEMRCVMFMWDDESMYRKLSIENREIRVIEGLLGKEWAKEFRTSLKYSEASWMYRAICYDSIRENLAGYEKKVMELGASLNAIEYSDDVKVQSQIEKIGKNLERYLKLIADTEGIIASRGKVGNKDIKAVLSGIEKFRERAKVMKDLKSVYLNG